MNPAQKEAAEAVLDIYLRNRVSTTVRRDMLPGLVEMLNTILEDNLQGDIREVLQEKDRRIRELEGQVDELTRMLIRGEEEIQQRDRELNNSRNFPWSRNLSADTS